MAVLIGDTAPDFTADTTEGTINFHEWLGDSWGVLFSHPKDFTPVCTTELGAVARLKPEFDKRGVKVIGLSVDATSDHEAWAADIEETQGTRPNFPIIGDSDFNVSKLYDMLPASTSGDAKTRTPADNQTVRNVFVIGPDKKVKLVLTYPMSTGRNFDRGAAGHRLAATDRQPQGRDAGELDRGDDVIIIGAVKDEEAKELFPDGWESPKPYLRVVKQPALIAGTRKSSATSTAPSSVQCKPSARAGGSG